MKFLVDVAEMKIGDVSVNLGGGNIGVAEHSLNGTEVCAVHKKVGGETVAEGVGGDVFGDAGKASVFLDNAFNRASRDAPKIAGSINGLLVFAIVEEEGGERIGAGGKIFLDMIGGGLINKDGAIFAAFAANDKFTTPEVDGIAIEIDKFGNAEAAREEKVNNSAIAEAIFGVERDDVKKFFNFIIVKEGNLLACETGDVDERGVEGFDVAAGEIR